MIFSRERKGERVYIAGTRFHGFSMHTLENCPYKTMNWYKVIAPTELEKWDEE